MLVPLLSGGSSSMNLYSTVRVMVCGWVGDSEAVGKRENLFCYRGELHITYDDGVTEKKGFPVALYAELIEHFTTTCDWVLFLSVCTGKIMLHDVHFVWG